MKIPALPVGDLKQAGKGLRHLRPRQRATALLRRLIEEGTLTPGEFLPSEPELARTFGVARNTLRLALGDLEAEGLLQTSQGKGRVVAHAGGSEHPLIRQTVGVVGDPPNMVHYPAHAMPGWWDFVQVSVTRSLAELELNALILQPEGLGRPQAGQLISDGLRGLICLSQPPTLEVCQALEGFRAAGSAVVAFGENPELAPFDTVVSDHALGSYLLTRWLIQQGRRRILRVWDLGPGRRPAWLKERDRGHQDALREAKLRSRPVVEFSFQPTGAGEDGFQEAARFAADLLPEHLTGRNSVDAIMVASDGHLFPFATACRLFGKEPGEDITIVGYDNYWADCFEREWESYQPPITVDKDNFEIGRSLVELLEARVAGKLPGKPQRRTVEPQLVVV